MDLHARKIEFVQEFLKIQREDVIVRLEKLLKKETSKAEKEEAKPFSIEEFNNRINKSMLDSKHNRLTENKNLLVEINKWH
jgi:hypothetical protein